MSRQAKSDDDGDEEPTNAGAHNFVEEADDNDYNFDHYNEFILCADANSRAPPPAALHTFPTNIDDKPTSPFKLINRKKHAPKANPGASDSDIMAAFYNYYCWLGNRGKCKNLLGSGKLSCDCLSILATNLNVTEAVATYICRWALKSYTEK
mmetsp:Transcript_1708/g.3252  ORF Transcript_1708/g.3252 Transcript_1708/m.3252 type:complete len:152 (+) Transcript_1708:3-458(+)